MRFIFVSLFLLLPAHAMADQLPHAAFRKPCGDVIAKAADQGTYGRYDYEDSNQEALLKLYERCLKLGPDAVGGTEGIVKYLKRSIRNARIDEARGAQSTFVGTELVVKRLERDHWSLAAQIGDPLAVQRELDDVLDAKTLAYSHLDEFKSEMTDTEIAVLLGYVVGFEVIEIAEIVQSTPENVYKIKKRAESKVKKVLSGGSLGESNPKSSFEDFIGGGLLALFLVYIAYVGFRGAYDAVFNRSESYTTRSSRTSSQANVNVQTNRSVNVNVRRN